MDPIVIDILVGQVNGLRQSAQSFDLQREGLLEAAESLQVQRDESLQRAAVLQRILDDSGYEPEPEKTTPVDLDVNKEN